jgi:subfamily B ATP-binding cassette protein MsbA
LSSNSGGELSWALLLFVPVVVTSSRKIGSEVRTRTRTGQDKLAEIQNILHETVTGNRIVKAFNTELWEILRFKKAAKRLFRANLRSVRIQSISSPLMDSIGAVAIAMMLFIGRNEIIHGRMTMGMFGALSFCSSSSTIRCANSPTSTTASSRPWAPPFRSSASSTPRTT